MQHRTYAGLLAALAAPAAMAACIGGGDGGSGIDADSAVARASLVRLDARAEVRFEPGGGETGGRARGGQPAEAAEAPLGGSEYAVDEEGLATRLQNPVADLISVPFQFNWDTGIGPDDDKDRLILNIQPVIPISLNEDWNVISRTIIPVVYVEGPTSDVDDAFGLSDVVQSFFFTPKDPVGGWILGVGPVAQIPTGTDDLFRSKQLSLGPTGIALRQQPIGTGTLTYGALANHLWRVAGSDEVADVNATFLQPFVAYTFKTATTVGMNMEATYDWTREEWSVPINASLSQLLLLRNQPVQFQLGGRYFAETFPNGPEWGIRFGMTLLFPR